jgi:23S rRNA pseudouridine1911/1915/1917 synthase
VEWVVDAPDRLDRFVAKHLSEHSRTQIAEHIKAEHVFVDGAAQKPSFRVLPGMTIRCETIPLKTGHDLEPVSIDLDIPFEDEHLLVVNKPRGLATHPASTLREPSLVNALLGRSTVLSGLGPSFRPGIVHRLDKETTGLLMVAKTDRVHRKLAAQIADRTVRRTYLAWVEGIFPEVSARIEAPIRRDTRNRLRMAIDPLGKAAITHVRRLQFASSETLLMVRLETGRTHQIRVHLQSVGYPILGDRLYGLHKQASGPLQLHATRLEFRHPETELPIDVTALPPEDFVAVSIDLDAALENFH